MPKIKNLFFAKLVANPEFFFNYAKKSIKKATIGLLYNNGSLKNDPSADFADIPRRMCKMSYIRN